MIRPTARPLFTADRRSGLHRLYQRLLIDRNGRRSVECLAEGFGFEGQHLWCRPTPLGHLHHGRTVQEGGHATADDVVGEALGGGLGDGADHLATVEHRVLASQQLAELVVAGHGWTVRTGRDRADPDLGGPAPPAVPQGVLVDDAWLWWSAVEGGHLGAVG